jgi:hypothetical protein
MREHKGPADLLTPIYVFGFAKATLARDCLFALLGISADGEDDGFKPDYSSRLEAVVWRYIATFV